MKWITFLVLSLLLNYAYGIESIDSLINISKNQSGKSFLLTNLKIAEHYAYGTNADSICYYANLCRDLAQEQEDSLSFLKATLYLGSGLYAGKQYQLSLKNTQEAFELATQLHQSKEILQSYYLKARNYQGLHQYQDAIFYFNKCYQHACSVLTNSNVKFALRYYQTALRQIAYSYWYAAKVTDGIRFFETEISHHQTLNQNLLRSYYANLAFLYNRGIDFKKAEEYLLKAAEISNQIGDTNAIYMDQAYLGALYSNLGDYPKAILHYENAYKIAEESQNQSLFDYILQNLGLCYDANGDLKKGVDLIFSGIQRAIVKKDTNAIAKAYQHLGRLMIKWHSFKDADKYLHKALHIHKKRKLDFLAVTDYTNLVISKIYQNEIDSCDFYLKVLKSKSDKIHATNAQCTYYLSKALLSIKYNFKPDSTLLYLIQADDLLKQSKSKALTTYSNYLHGKYYMKQNQYLLAKPFLLKAWKTHKSVTMLQDVADMAKSVSNNYFKLNKPDSAYFFLQKADSVSNKIHHREDVLLLYQKDNDFEVLQANAKNQNLNRENKNLTQQIILIRIFYVVLTLTLLTLISIFVKKRTKQLQTKIRIKDQLAEKLRAKTSKSLEILDQTQKDIQSKEQYIKQLQSQLKTDNLPTSSFNELEYLCSEKLITEEDWDRFIQLFTGKNPDFMLKLKSQFPNLSKNDIKILVLIKLGLTTREMAKHLMVSPASVNTARYRLRKKLGLQNCDKLESLIQQLDNDPVLPS